MSRPRTVSAELRLVGRRGLAIIKRLAKSAKNCLDCLVVKFDCCFQESLADTYKTHLEAFLKGSNVVFRRGEKWRGSIILTFKIESISSATFNKLVDEVEHNLPDACGIGLATDGAEDILQEATDEYEVTFEKWVNLHSRIAPVIIKDSVAEPLLAQAVYCQSLTKRRMCCRNKTKDPSMRCWRHRG